MKKTLGVVAAATLAAMPILGVGAADLVTTQTDTLKITVNDSCELKYQSTAHTNGSGTAPGTWSGNTLSATIANNAADTNIGGTSFHVVCNDNGGYDVKVKTEALDGAEAGESIPYITAASAPAAGTSSWGINNGTAWILDEGVVKTAAAATDGTDFAVTYGVATSSTLAADTYEGDAVYTLTHPADK